MKFVGLCCCDQRVVSLAFMELSFALQPISTFHFLFGIDCPIQIGFVMVGFRPIKIELCKPVPCFA